MKLVHTVADWRQQRAEAGLTDDKIGFVPTLGALHAGHESLLRRSLTENRVTVLSIFLNPTQFDDPGDLTAYPGSFDGDLEVARKLGVDYVFCPTPEEIYPGGYRYRVSESELSGKLCGAHHQGHFDGVLTVVLKLLQIVRPARAYFGEKDYQQLELVRGMVREFFLTTEIVACPTVRHADGLAVASRNEKLNDAQRRLAPLLAALLASAESPDQVARELTAKGFEVDYVEELDGRRYAAARLGAVRLIDNLPIASSVPADSLRAAS